MGGEGVSDHEVSEVAVSRARSPGPGVRCLLAAYGGGVAVNPRDMKKFAPILGVLLIAAAVLYVVGRFLL